MGAMLVRHEPASASMVRHELATDLDRHGVDGTTIHEVTLVASELVVNALRHARTTERDELRVHWTVGPDGVVVVAVEDPSEEIPVPRKAARDAPSGRGLTIVAALSAGWGYELTPRGKRVWAKVALRKVS